MVYASREEYRRLGFIHRWNAVATLVLLLTGLLLYAEPLRGLMAPVRVPLKYLHICTGLILAAWAVQTAADWGRFVLRSGLQAGRRWNAVLTVLWLTAWTATGLLMWLRGAVPYEVSNLATDLHDWFTWAALPWVTIHIAFRLQKVRRLDERLASKRVHGAGVRRVAADWLAAPATRRAILWTGFSALGLILGGRWFRTLAPAPEARAEPPVDPATLAGGGMKGRFRLYFVNDTIPTFDPSAWKLTVGARTLTWDQLLALPRVEMVSNFHCVTGWSVFNVTWEGVRVRDLLAHAGVAPSKVLLFHSGDGEYTDSLTWEQAQQAEVVLAFQMEGRPLPAAQGGPVRLLVPRMYGYKSVKWVEKIEPSEQEQFRGYWQERGYNVDAYLERGEPVRGASPGQ